MIMDIYDFFKWMNKWWDLISKLEYSDYKKDSFFYTLLVKSKK